MSLRIRLIMGTLRLGALPGRVLRRLRGLPEPGPEAPLAGRSVLLYRNAGEDTEFAHFVIYPDRATERFGLVGFPAPGRTHSSGAEALIEDQIAELQDDGYEPAENFTPQSTLEIKPTGANPASDWAQKIYDQVNANGLGSVSQAAQTLILKTPASETAVNLIKNAETELSTVAVNHKR